MKTVKGTLSIGRFEVPYRKYGDNDNVMVCVSGALQTMAIWRSVVKRFTGDLTVVIFDMPGIGRSKIISGGARITVEEQVETLHAIITETHTGGGELALAGSSWGTAIAAAYAALYPNAVQHLVLSSFGMQPNEGMRYLVERASVLYEAGDYAGGANLILELFGAQIGEGYKKQIIAQFKQLNEAHAASFYEHTANILKLGRLDEVVDLTKIKARTLIINGADDTIIDVADMYVAEKLIPDCELLLVQGVGHFLHFERPELLDDYERFLVPDSQLAISGSPA
ncbi:MAG: alpha/beta hydrolase [Pseudomonadales bacterium]|nr:alpha/beta hydrolase [Pseudomonadales bacterium]